MTLCKALLTISLLFSTGTALIAGDEEDLKASFKAALESLNTKDLEGFQKAWHTEGVMFTRNRVFAFDLKEIGQEEWSRIFTDLFPLPLSQRAFPGREALNFREDTLQHLQDETEIPGAETSVTRSSGSVVFPWTGLAHLDVPSLNGAVIEVADCLFSLLLIGHLNKAESFGLPGVLIVNDVDARDFPELAKHSPQIVLGHRVGQITNVDVHRSLLSRVH